MAFYDVDAKRYTEYAWGGGRDRFSWPHQVRICTLPELYRVLDVMLMALGVDRLESCQLPE